MLGGSSMEEDILFLDFGLSAIELRISGDFEARVVDIQDRYSPIDVNFGINETIRLVSDRHNTWNDLQKDLLRFTPYFNINFFIEVCEQ